MLKHLLVVIIAISACGFLYGIYNYNVEVESNACQMTYMFAPPQFSRIDFEDNVKFPHYGLYYYNEGRIPIEVHKNQFNGAPIIFVPGNGGSYKQVRSLASVALRKSRESATRIHLDYFTIDYNEELSALYGDYLERQTLYLKTCIKIVLKLYTKTEQAAKVILIGHSMGAVVSQAVLRDPEFSESINTILSLSSPINKPILILDEKIHAFYKSINKNISVGRSSLKLNKNSNFCCATCSRLLLNNHTNYEDQNLKNVLIITIGGGNRDVLVPAGFTISKYSDIHAMTMSIPKVWLSCDHLSAVWCLQLVQVINRYMFDISVSDKQNFVYFTKDRIRREQAALTNFVKSNIMQSKEINIEQEGRHNSVWREDTLRVFSKGFKEGPRSNFIQLIPIRKHKKHTKLCIDVTQLESDDFLFGCTIKSRLNNDFFCQNKVSLSYNFQILPSIKNKIRSVAILDINNLKNTYVNWTHVGFFARASRKPKMYNVDIFNPAERNVVFKFPRWSTFQKSNLVNESSQGTLYYKLLVQGVEETFPTIELRIVPLSCMGDLNSIIIKMCIPWAPGFNKYQIIRDPSTEVFYMNVPVSSPVGYNSSMNPISLEIFLDPLCRYQISYKFSIVGTMSRIAQQFFHWLPSHLTAVILVILKNQISKLHEESSTKGVRPYHGYFQYDSLYLITGCRVLSKFVTHHDDNESGRSLSIYPAVIIHGTAIVLSILLVFAVWTAVILNAYGLSKLINWFFLRSVLLPIADTFPILIAAFLISLAIRTCGAVALIITCALYLLLISNAYSDYLENWLLRTAVLLHAKFRSLYDKQNGLNTTTDISSDTTSLMSLIRCEGMNNFSFHLSVLILLTIMTGLNSMTFVAWAKDRSIVSRGTDPSLLPTVIVISSLSVLWRLKAPKKIFSFQVGYTITSLLIYMGAGACIIYCQDELYKLNYLIAGTFVLITVLESLGQCYKKFS
ncbi:GPI inositol-deacylase [Bactrocera oleae]|uniref:GPI inositol-deacylase n=1 Tax=Bactrocera oleae TaxID=104688 RepID=UPI00387E224A